MTTESLDLASDPLIDFRAYDSSKTDAENYLVLCYRRLAYSIVDETMNCFERVAALDKLIESMDCSLRAMQLDQQEADDLSAIREPRTKTQIVEGVLAALEGEGLRISDFVDVYLEGWYSEIKKAKCAQDREERAGRLEAELLNVFGCLRGAELLMGRMLRRKARFS